MFSLDPVNPDVPEPESPEGDARDHAGGPIAAGQDALRAGLWHEAKSAFEVALESGEDPAALEGMGHAMWWLGERERSHRISERAYVRYREDGDGRSAARVALWLAREFG